MLKVGSLVLLASIATPAAAEITDIGVRQAEGMIRGIFEKNHATVDHVTILRTGGNEMKALADLTYRHQHLQSVCAITVADGKMLATCHEP